MGRSVEESCLEARERPAARRREEDTECVWRPYKVAGVRGPGELRKLRASRPSDDDAARRSAALWHCGAAACRVGSASFVRRGGWLHVIHAPQKSDNSAYNHLRRLGSDQGTLRSSRTWLAERLKTKQPCPRHAFVYTAQYARCVATPVWPIQNFGACPEYVRRIAQVSPPLSLGTLVAWC